MPSTKASGNKDPKRPSTSGKTGGKMRWMAKHDIFAEAIVNGRTIKDAFTLAGGNPNGGSTPSRWLSWGPMKDKIARLRAERMDRLALDRDQVILDRKSVV